jgi:hypothetical protein
MQLHPRRRVSLLVEPSDGGGAVKALANRQASVQPRRRCAAPQRGAAGPGRQRPGGPGRPPGRHGPCPSRVATAMRDGAPSRRTTWTRRPRPSAVEPGPAERPPQRGPGVLGHRRRGPAASGRSTTDESVAEVTESGGDEVATTKVASRRVVRKRDQAFGGARSAAPIAQPTSSVVERQRRRRCG